MLVRTIDEEKEGKHRICSFLTSLGFFGWKIKFVFSILSSLCMKSEFAVFMQKILDWMNNLANYK